MSKSGVFGCVNPPSDGSMAMASRILDCCGAPIGVEYTDMGK
jgi:hypothetical protein